MEDCWCVMWQVYKTVQGFSKHMGSKPIFLACIGVVFERSPNGSWRANCTDLLYRHIDPQIDLIGAHVESSDKLFAAWPCSLVSLANTVVLVPMQRQRRAVSNRHESCAPLSVIILDLMVSPHWLSSRHMILRSLVEREGGQRAKPMNGSHKTVLDR